MGAWIEIYKFKAFPGKENVAPLVGAWIEINYCQRNMRPKKVAPLVGAWIEIAGNIEARNREACRSSRGSVD